MSRGLEGPFAGRRDRRPQFDEEGHQRVRHLRARPHLVRDGAADGVERDGAVHHEQQINHLHREQRARRAVAREGDLVSDIMLKMNGLTQDALAAIEYVECSIGGNVIDRQYGDWMNIWSDLSHNIDKTKLLNELRNGRGFIDVPVTIDQNQPSPIEMSNLQIDEIIETKEINTEKGIHLRNLRA